MRRIKCIAYAVFQKNSAALIGLEVNFHFAQSLFAFTTPPTVGHFVFVRRPKVKLVGWRKNLKTETVI